jgi:DNA-directed RNA polymerase subunit RPC12/RpoP
VSLSFISTQPATAEPNTLRYRLHKLLSGKQPGRSLHTLHASDLTRETPAFCPRRRVIQIVSNMKPPDEHVRASDAVTHEYGLAIERMAVSWFAAGGMAVGDWQCVVCKNIAQMTYVPVECPECHHKVSYGLVQRRFRSALTGASCGIDVLVSGMSAKLRVVEIKSIQKDDFKKLVGPLAEHRLRTNLYLRIVAESADEDRHKIDLQTAHVLYVVKGGWGEQVAEVKNWKFGDQGWTPFKDYEVKRDDEATDAVYHRALEYRQAMEQKKIPAGICSSMHDAQAKACPVSAQCFGGKFPVGGDFA